MMVKLDEDLIEIITGKNLLLLLDIIKAKDKQHGVSRAVIQNEWNGRYEKQLGKTSLRGYLNTLYNFHAIEFKEKQEGDDYNRISLTKIGLAMLTGKYTEGHIKKTFTTKEISNNIYKIQNYLEALQSMGIIEKPHLDKANKIIDGILENTGKYGIGEVAIAGLRELKDILVQVVKIQKLPGPEEYNRFVEIVDDLIDFYRQKIPKPKRESTIHPKRMSMIPP